MANVQNQDFSLLSQSEIDTLINFINDKREGVDSSVLNQESIDKLLEMLRFNNGRAKKEEILHMGEVEGTLADLITGVTEMMSVRWSILWMRRMILFVLRR